MEIIKAIILGVVEGITEFLPISSTGHLIVTADMLRFKDAAKIFTVVIQVGAIAAVIWFYRRDIWQRIVGIVRRDKTDLRFLRNLIIATIPAGVIGLLLDSTMEKYSVTLTVAIALIAGGFVLLWAENRFAKTRHDKSDASLDGLSSRQALAVGVAQVFSLVPGVSRSGATIVGGMLAGLSRVQAAAFSFWLAMPVIILASGYKLIKGRDELTSISGGPAAIVLGTIAAFISALFVVSWLLRYVSKHDFKPFAYYRIGFGIMLIILIVTGFMTNSGG